MQPRTLLDIMTVAERLKDTTRHCYTSKGRHESVAEHSWMAALMAFFLRDEFPEASVSLMGQYTPFGRALSMPGLNRRLKKKEYARVLAHMEAIGLDGYRQELESASEAFVPAFDGTGVMDTAAKR